MQRGVCKASRGYSGLCKDHVQMVLHTSSCKMLAKPLYRRCFTKPPYRAGFMKPLCRGYFVKAWNWNGIAKPIMYRGFQGVLQCCPYRVGSCDQFYINDTGNVKGRSVLANIIQYMNSTPRYDSSYMFLCNNPCLKCPWWWSVNQ